MSQLLTMEFSLDLDRFSLQPNVQVEFERLSFFGPSGAGKSLLMDCLAGVRTPDAGRISVGDRVFFDRAEQVWLPPEERNIGYLMQSAPLFPHLDVSRNVTYGNGLSPSDERGTNILNTLEINPLMDRSVDELSGGEKRRVALAQVLFSDPDLLLLDEPLVGLNAELRAKILPFLRRVVDRLDIPVIHVSHRPEEVLSLSRSVIRIRDGNTQVKQEVESFFRRDSAGEPKQEGIQSNVLRATITQHSDKKGTISVETGNGTKFRIPDKADFEEGDPVVLEFYPGDLIVARNVSGAISPRNQWTCSIHSLHRSDGTVELVLETEAGDRFRARVTRETAEEMDLLEDTTVIALLKTHAITVHPA